MTISCAYSFNLFGYNTGNLEDDDGTIIESQIKYTNDTTNVSVSNGGHSSYSSDASKYRFNGYVKINFTNGTNLTEIQNAIDNNTINVSSLLTQGSLDINLAENVKWNYTLEKNILTVNFTGIFKTEVIEPPENESNSVDRINIDLPNKILIAST